MTLAETINSLLSRLHKAFYEHRDWEYHRDKRALTMALSRWGHECQQRGWEFGPERVYNELSCLIEKIRQSGAEPEYLPAYLQGAISRWIGQHAEELHDSRVEDSVSRIISGVRPVAEIRTNTTETLAALYRDLKHKRPKKCQCHQRTLGLHLS